MQMRRSGERMIWKKRRRERGRIKRMNLDERGKGKNN